MGLLNNGIKGRVFKFGSRDKFIQVRHIGLVVFFMMKRECLGRDMRFEGTFLIWELWQSYAHVTFPPFITFLMARYHFLGALQT